MTNPEKAKVGDPVLVRRVAIRRQPGEEIPLVEDTWVDATVVVPGSDDGSIGVAFANGWRSHVEKPHWRFVRRYP